MSFLHQQRIVVTGGAGFLGCHVCRELAGYQPQAVVVPRSRDYDLRDRDEIRRLFRDAQPSVVVHLAGVVGGIEANRRNPGRFFYDNAIMGIQLIEEARQHGVAKFVLVGTICSYPANTPVPFREDELWNGYPEPTNAPYGLAKKMLIVQAQAYRQQFGFPAICLLPVNLYGPGDNFDPVTSHVIPALIRKFLRAKEAGEDWIEVWGSGKASREFLFVRDAAAGIVLAAERYDQPDPVNLGSGQEVPIRDLVELIGQLCDFRGEIRWDPSRPDGQLRRALDTSRALRAFGFQARTGLREGLRETIEWARTHVDLAPAAMGATTP